MQVKNKYKKAATGIAAAILAIVTAASVCFGLSTERSANAAEPATSATVMSYVTSNGMPSGSMTVDSNGNPTSPKMYVTNANKDTLTGEFNLLINPTDNLASKPGASGMIIDFANIVNGVDTHFVVSLNPADNKSGDATKWAVLDMDVPGEDSNIALDKDGNPMYDADGKPIYAAGTPGQMTFTQAKNSDGTWKTIPKSEITYNQTTGILTIAGKYQSYEDITIYNYLSEKQVNTTHRVYGAYTLDGQVKTLKGTQVSFDNDPTYKNMVCYQLGTNAGGATEPEYNAIMNEMPSQGGSQMYTGYKVDTSKLALYAATIENGKIIHLFPLSKGADYSIGSDGTISLADDLMADNIIIVSSAETRTTLIIPKVKSKSDTSLTFYAAPGYSYKLYKEDKTTVVATKTGAKGEVSFTGLDKDQDGNPVTYYIQAIPPASSNLEPSDLRKVRTDSSYKPFEFSFKAGDTFSALVYVGGHWSGQLDVEGTNRKLGHTIFSCSFTDIECSNDELKQLLWDNKDFQGMCCSPGAGYSSGHSKWASGKVLWVDNANRKAKVFISMSGEWRVGGHKIQNICANITFSGEPTGSVEIQKTSTDPNSLNNPYYNFDGITYTLTGENTGSTYDLVLDEDGYARADNVVLDTYDVEETDTNEWYQLSDETYSVTVNSDTTNGFTQPVKVKNNEGGSKLKDEPTYVKLDLTKESSNPSVTNHNTAIYDTRGAVYTVRCTTPLNDQKDMNKVSNWIPAISGQEDTLMQTKGDNPLSAKAESGKLLYGDYEVYETTPAKNYGIDTTVYAIGHDKFDGMQSANPKAYHITQADAKGSAIADEKELVDTPFVDFSFDIQKLDDLNNDKYGEGKTDLSAVFEVRYYNTVEDGYDSSKPFDKWYIRTDKNGHADLDFIKDNPVVSGTRTEQGMSDPYTYNQNPDNGGRFYTQKNADGEEHVVMPVGYIEVQEVVAPNGYLYDSGSPFGPGVVHKYRNNGLTITETDVMNGRYDTKRAEQDSTFGTVPEHIYRGDLMFLKKKAGTGDEAKMSYIPFIIESLTTGEKHLIVTDENGKFDSVSYEMGQPDGYPHSRNTNYNDQFLGWTDDGQPYITDESKLRHDVGTFFYGYGPKSEKDNSATTEMKETDGALPYDDYVITEVRCSNNEGLELIRDTFSITRTKEHFNKGEIEDYPTRIHTTATGGSTIGETTIIKDDVFYEGLKKNTTYKMVGTLMDKDTNAPLVDENGNTFVVEQEFTTPENDTQGTVTMVFEVPSSVVKSKTTVVFEDCFLDGIKVAYHTDINDEGQTVTYPKVHTTATDSVTGDHEGNLLDEDIVVVDAVQCSGLIIGEEYTVKGHLMNRETGDRLVDGNGNEFTAEETFVATEKEMTVELRFGVPKEVIAGKTVVAFEDLYNKGIIVGTHSDLNDEEQTVYYPALRTTATDSVTKDHEGLANETITINDLVEYENLIKGETYTISGKIMDKDTGEALKGPDGKEFTASATFVAGESNAKSDELSEAEALVKAYLDTAEKMFGVMDKMTSEEMSEIAKKMGVETMPAFNGDEIKAAVESASKDGASVWTDDQKTMLESFDKFYLALSEDQQKETGELVSVEKLTGAVNIIAADNKAKAETEAAAKPADENAKPERVNGSVIVSFEIPADVVRGKATVVFENLYFGEEPNDENHKAKHEDINDEGQMVVYPEIGTMATIDGQKIAPARDSITITDTVSYTNLTPGKEYTIKGKLMDKTTNETVKNADGTEVVGETVFKPETANGTVEVQFVFDAMAIQFHDVVVFEEAWRESDVADELILVAEHKDIEDADQTVRIDDAGLADELIETGELPQTGEIIFYIVLVVSFLAGSYWFAYRHRKRNLFE